MAKKDAQGTEAGVSLDPRVFLNPNGYTINWSYLGATVIGGTILAYFEGVARVVLAFANLLLSAPRGLASFFGDVIELVVGFPAVIVDRGWQAAIPFVQDAGIAGFVVAVAIVLATFYVVARVIDRAR